MTPLARTLADPCRVALADVSRDRDVVVCAGDPTPALLGALDAALRPLGAAPQLLAPALPRTPPRWRATAFRACPTVRLASPERPDGIVVPEAWLAPTTWIAVASGRWSPRTGLDGVLALHADLLRALNAHLSVRAAACEAWRLGVPDLAIVVRPGGAPPVLAGGDLLAVDHAAARQAGVRLADLPAWAAVLPAAADAPRALGDGRPGLAARGLCFAARLHARATAVATLLHAVPRDARAAAGRVRRAPGFVRRRLGRGAETPA